MNNTWISCVDSKAKFITEIKNFLEYVNTQFDSKVGTVRVDNEFTTRQWEKLFESYRIIIEGVETYFASQNGVVERAYRELKDSVHIAHYPLVPIEANLNKTFNTQFDSKVGIVCVDNKFPTRQ
jgi:hypothetical protein